MESKTYFQLAEFYDHLMRSIDYEGWAQYISDIIEENGFENPSVLELAGGNGQLAGKLKNDSGNYILTDLSLRMLKTKHIPSVFRVCCDMTALPFNRLFDVIISTFDSVNYLMSHEKLKKLFNEVADCLKPEGIFTFDVSLEQNSIKFQKYLNRKGKFNKLKYEQKSYYDEKTRIHHNYFVITGEDGTEYSEKHKQKIYRFEDYFQAVESSELYVHNCYEAFTFKDADANCERAQFILKKRIR